MSTAEAHHPGLPFVPPPAPDELLGSWLLRIAQLYGPGLTTLLNRLAARSSSDEHAPHWFAIDADSISLDALSAASRLSQADLAAMAPKACRPRWPEELGACLYCLDQARDTDQPITWSRNWVSPLATTCGIHRIWLTPVAYRSLARIRYVADFASTVHQAKMSQVPSDEELDLVDDALWLQERCTMQSAARMPWGVTRTQVLLRIMDVLGRTVMDQMGHQVDVGMQREDHRQWLVRDFTLELASGSRGCVSLPSRLRLRQWVLGRVGHLLRHAPEARILASSSHQALITRLTSTSTQGWPLSALAWICPEAAEFVRWDAELRRALGVSPKYFKARSALPGYA